MKSVLAQLNMTPGVVGSLVCSDEGRVLADAFPPLFDADMLYAVAATLPDCSPAGDDAAGSVSLIDFRYNDSRIIIKPLSGGFLFLLCTKAINMQLMGLSLNLAAKKIEKLILSLPSIPADAPVVRESTKPVRTLPQFDYVLPFSNLATESIPREKKDPAKKSNEFWSFTISQDW